MNGDLAAQDHLWYDANYLGPITPLNPTYDKDDLYKFLQDVRFKLKRHSYQQTLESAIIRYTRALDERNWHNSFLRLWSLLELLTDTAKSNYDVTIDRTSYIFEEHNWHKQILQHLREHRNKFVHTDEENSEIEIYLYQLKYYIEGLLQFHLDNTFKFTSIQEAGNFLSLPHDKDELANQIEMRKGQIKMRKYAQKFRHYI
jgi:hypothetical protein